MMEVGDGSHRVAANCFFSLGAASFQVSKLSDLTQVKHSLQSLAEPLVGLCTLLLGDLRQTLLAWGLPLHPAYPYAERPGETSCLTLHSQNHSVGPVTLYSLEGAS